MAAVVDGLPRSGRILHQPSCRSSGLGCHDIRDVLHDNLVTSARQKVVTSDPLAFVRHPGYLGEVTIWAGFAVVSSNLALLFLLPAMFMAVYPHRISAGKEC